MAKKALITGITGQDGSYLAELLLGKGYEVVGVTSGRSNRCNLAAVESRIEWVEGDITDESFVRDIIKSVKPDEIYNLASVATVAKPWDGVPTLSRVVALSPVYFLEAIRSESPSTRFFQASSAELFGAASESPQNEKTPFHPRNPYGIAKSFAHSMVAGYRAQHGLFAVSGILYTHESPRRPKEFVTRKITSSLANIKRGVQASFELGNLESMRDWGFAGDYVEAMWRMLQAETPEDYVIASGATHTVRELVQAAAAALDMPISFEGSGADEVAKDASGKVILAINPEYYRPVEPVPLRGDCAKIERDLGWKPEESFQSLVRMMAESDWALASASAAS